MAAAEVVAPESAGVAAAETERARAMAAKREAVFIVKKWIKNLK